MVLLEEFAAARARGDRPDAAAYLARAGAGADELAQLIDGLVRRTEPPAPDPALVAMMEALASGDPPLLGARLRRRLGVDAVVAGLVGTLHLDPARRDRVKRHYQRLEGGLLDPSRLDPRLVVALADALGVRAADLGLAAAATAADGRPLARGGPGAAADAPSAGPPDRSANGAPEADEIDRLFGLA